jgi:anthranilate phosphoribosyltransferase
LVIGEKAADFNEGIRLAQDLIESGAAARKLRELKEASRAV